MTGEEIIRLNYYERQFLGVRDFRDEQTYHVDMRRRHNLAHHTCGIVAGLEIEEQAKEGSADEVDVYVKPGIAIDGFGREIVVLASAKLDTSLFQPYSTDDHYPVWIAYKEELYQSPAYGYDNCATTSQRTRVLESYRICVGTRTSTHDSVTVEGNAVPDADLPRDASVPYQEFPVAGEDDLWLLRLGSVHWNGKKFVAAAAGRLNESRDYIGIVADEVLAPDGTLLLRDRSTPSPLDPTADGVAVTIEGSLDVMRDVEAEQNVHVGGDETIDGKLGVGTTAPDTKVQVMGGTNAGLGAGTGYVVVGDTGATNLVVDDTKIQARDSGSAGTLDLQSYGGDLIVHGNSSDAAERVIVTGDGNVGIGTTSPDVRLHVTSGTDTKLDAGTGYVVVGDVTGLNLCVDNNEIMARNNGGTATLHVQADGGDFELHANRTDADSKILMKDDGSVGIGTTSPAAKLDVYGRILRRGQDFSRAGLAFDSQAIPVPWGSTDDWNIFVAPRSMGEEHPDDEGDNALLMMECYATTSGNTSWVVTARYKYKYDAEVNAGNGLWRSGTANYMLVPK